MLGRDRSLYFPRLIRVNRVPIRDDGEREAYCLYWARMERELKLRHHKWVDDHWPQHRDRLVFVPAMPSGFEWVNDVVYVLSDSYLNEIRRMAQLALSEWNVHRPFDTAIREGCLSPAIELIKCCFLLLGDCVYDPNTRYFSREPRSRLLRYILGYRFWFHQTGSGLIWNHSGLQGFDAGSNLEFGDLVSTLRSHIEEIPVP